MLTFEGLQIVQARYRESMGSHRNVAELADRLRLVACNARDLAHELPSSTSRENDIKYLGDELGEVVLYADALATALSVSLEYHVRQRFNFKALNADSPWSL